MTANKAITEVINVPITTTSKNVSELLIHLKSFGFHPENLLPYFGMMVIGYVVVRAIDNRYALSANIEHNGNTYQLNLQPEK